MFSELYTNLNFQSAPTFMTVRISNFSKVANFGIDKDPICPHFTLVIVLDFSQLSSDTHFSENV